MVKSEVINTQLLFVSARWDKDDYDVRLGYANAPPAGTGGTALFWTITARELPPSVYNRGYSATREEAMADFKARGNAICTS